MRNPWDDAGFVNLIDVEGAPPVARRHICNFGGGGGSGGVSTQTQQTSLPDWVNNAAQQNYGMATNAAYTLMQPYSGPMVAPLTGGQQANINAAQANVGSTNAAYNQAQGATSNFLNYNAPQVNPQTLAGTNLNPYMNPYTQSVINPSMQLLNQQNQQGLNTIGAQAAGANAFGGSRQGVAEGVQNAQSNLLAGQLGASLYGQNFQQAQAAATGDITRNMTAQQLNQQAGLSSAGLDLAAAQQLGNLAGQGQNAYLTGLSAAQQLQNQQQAQAQNVIAGQQQQYAAQQQYPLQQLQILQNALAQSPYGRTITTTGPGPSTNTGMQAAGMGIGGIGALGSLFGGGSNSAASGIGSAIGGLGSWLGGGLGSAGASAALDTATAALPMLSDRRLKTDIKKVGVDEPTGLKLFGYRYKGDPKTYPKVVGPMAQDIQKKFPDEVVPVGGYLAVKPNFLAGVMQRAA